MSSPAQIVHKPLSPSQCENNITRAIDTVVDQMIRQLAGRDEFIKYDYNVTGYKRVETTAEGIDALISYKLSPTPTQLSDQDCEKLYQLAQTAKRLEPVGHPGDPVARQKMIEIIRPILERKVFEVSEKFSDTDVVVKVDIQVVGRSTSKVGRCAIISWPTEYSPPPPPGDMEKVPVDLEGLILPKQFPDPTPIPPPPPEPEPNDLPQPIELPTGPLDLDDLGGIIEKAKEQGHNIPKPPAAWPHKTKPVTKTFN